MSIEHTDRPGMTTDTEQDPAQRRPDAAEPVVDTRGPGKPSCADLTNQAVERTPVGAGFVLVSDHDPTALRYMLQAERPGQIQWQPLQQGPETWRVRVDRVAAEA